MNTRIFLLNQVSKTAMIGVLLVLFICEIGWSSPEVNKSQDHFSKRNRTAESWGGWFFRKVDHLLSNLPDPYPEKGSYAYSTRISKEELPPVRPKPKPEPVTQLEEREKMGETGEEGGSGIHTGYENARFGYRSAAFEEMQRKERDLQAARVRENMKIKPGLPISNYTRTFLDEVSSFWLRSATSATFLAIGNSVTPLTEGEKKQIQDLAENLFRNGKRVVYDAESQAAPVIRNAIPEGYRLGIGSDWSQLSPDVLVISNPYRRLTQILAFDSILLSPDSVLGAGLLIEGYGKSKIQVFDLAAESQWLKGLSGWSSSVEKTGNNLGLHYSTFNEPKTFRKADEFTEFGFDRIFSWRDPGAKLPLKFPRFILEEVMARMTSREILDLHKRAITYEKFSQTLNVSGSGGAAVVFGSGRGSDHYESLVQEVTLGFAEKGCSITTGGAGGFMETANRVAIKAGVPSIGIPLGIRHQISSERFTGDRYHTLTVSVPGYPFRIPLLLQKKTEIIIAPGGSGTMHELATTFVLLASELGVGADSIPRITFLSGEYYGSLFEWFQTLPFPEIFKKRLFLVNSKADLKS